MKRVYFALFLLFLSASPAQAAVNRPPTANALTVYATEDVSTALTITGTDPEGAALTFSVTTPTKGTLTRTAQTATSQTYTYTPNANTNGNDAFTFTVSDGSRTSQARVTLVVAATNDTPTISVNSSYAVNEDNSITIRPTVQDVDGDTLSVRTIVSPRYGTVTLNANVFVYTPVANYFGTDSFTAVVSDGRSDSSPATVAITVNAVNDMPTVASQAVDVSENGNVALTLNALDADNDPLTVTLNTRPSHGDVVLPTSASTTPVVLYTPEAGYIGTDTFTYRVTDGSAWSGTATVTLNVRNAGPVLEDQELSAIVGRNILIPPATIERSLAYTIVTPPTKGTISVAGDYLVYSPTMAGADVITYTVQDAQGASSNVATIRVANQPAGTVTPILLSNLEPVSGMTIVADENKITTQFPQNDCYAFIEGAPLVIPVQIADDEIVDALAGTLHSVCENTRTDVDIFAFFILPDGSAWRFTSERSMNLRLDSLNTGYYDPSGILTYFAHSTRNDSGDPDMLTGGVAQFIDDELVFSDEQYGHNFDMPTVSLDGIFPLITMNPNIPNCLLKLHSEECGSFLFMNAQTRETLLHLYAADLSGFEAWNSAASTMVEDLDGTRYWAFGTGPGGNVQDDPEIGGGCKGYIFNGTTARDQILQGLFNASQAATYDPGDRGCVGDDEVTHHLKGSALIGEAVPGFHRTTNETLFWFKSYEPAIAGGSETPISVVNTSGQPLCEVWVTGDTGRTPFRESTTGIVIDHLGNGYTNVDSSNSRGVAITGVMKIDPTSCSTTMLVEFERAQVGGSVSNVTLAQNAQGNHEVLYSVGGVLYAYTLETEENVALASFGDVDDEVVSGAVITNTGDILVSGLHGTFWNIPATGRTYGDNFWARYRGDNIGSGTAIRSH